MHCLEPLLIDVGINLRRRNVGMAEHFLDNAQIGAVAEQMRGETVPEQVRINVRFQSGMFRVFFHDLPDAHRGQLRPAFGQKNLAASAAFHQLRPFRRQVAGERFARFSANRNKARLISFSSHAQNAFFGRKIFQARN